MNFATQFESLYPKYQGFQLLLFDFSLQFPFVSYDASQFFCDCIKPEMDKGSKNLIPINILSLFFQLMLEEHFRHLNKLTMNMSRYIICEIAAFVNESLFHQWYANVVNSFSRSGLIVKELDIAFILS